MDEEFKRMVRAAKYCVMFGVGFFMVGLMLVVASIVVGKVDAAVPSGVLLLGPAWPLAALATALF